MSKMYLVTEEELEILRSKHKKTSHTWGSGTQEDWLEAVEQEQQAEAACRVRPVPEWAKYFAGRIELQARGMTCFTSYMEIKK